MLHHHTRVVSGSRPTFQILDSVFFTFLPIRDRGPLEHSDEQRRRCSVARRTTWHGTKTCTPLGRMQCAAVCKTNSARRLDPRNDDTMLVFWGIRRFWTHKDYHRKYHVGSQPSSIANCNNDLVLKSAIESENILQLGQRRPTFAYQFPSIAWQLICRLQLSR